MKCRTFVLSALLSSLTLACAPAGFDAPDESVDGQNQALAGDINYEGLPLTEWDVYAFRAGIYWGTKGSLLLPDGIKEWNANLLNITENRKSTYKNGKLTFFYSWCGDWVTYHLARAGSQHGLALNRIESNGTWTPEMNLTWLRAWAGEPYQWTLSATKKRFKNDPSARKSWHAWSAAKAGPSDGYVPQAGDLIVIKRAGGDHIEHFLEQVPGTTNMIDSAGAQAGGVAMEVTRNMKSKDIIAVIDVSRLAPSTGF
jgi:hypothetical protein